ncbi:ribosomal protein S18-alanine N-acetyltransferase [Curvibacter sp. CHRR-16]|uniref:ribosomal protein S18-alanine N-acetyltransferase n=1 Tax=Curvibacter sp. CHRR-16 TaxID=2835872 RepID=UPI001BDACDEB|nr:ribosomal protein S18-alanine N-acetyltransferase [Curvibacter sp. CHRR-16]MBT0570031.1 ribosomal protein S18-alanine N-acetyltransferase [Curvibacter sp. CHRR-16]
MEAVPTTTSLLPPTGLDLFLTPVLQADVAAVAALEQQAYAHPWSAQDFEASLEHGYHLQLLRNGHKQLLGYYVAFRVLDEAHLLNVAVLPACQGRGLGAYLMAAMHLWATSETAQCVWLEVRAGNGRARQLYQRLGYREVGQRKGYYPAEQGVREDAIVMRLDLRTAHEERV